MLKLGSRNVSKLFLGGRAISNAYLGNRLVWQSTKPLPYDYEVEWIANASSTTGAYIKTGYIPLNNAGDVTFDMKVRQNIAFTSDVGLIGARSNFAARTCWALPLIQGGTGYQFGYGSIYYNLDSQQSLVSKDVRIWTTISNGNMVSNFDDGSSVYTYSTPKQSFACDYDIWLFATNNLGSPLFGNTAMFYGRIYYCKIYENERLVRDLIPVVKIENNVAVGYMYDKVTGQMFGNQGTGSFVIGPAKYDAEIEYLERSGTQWIDTGFNLVETTDVVDITMAQTQFSTSFMFAWSCTRSGSGLESYTRGVGFYGRSNSIRCVLQYTGGTSWYSSFGIVQPNQYVAFTADFPNSTCQANGESGTFAGKNTANTTIKLLQSSLVRVASFSITRSGAKVIDLIPVRVGQKGYMYDKVSGQMFWKQGTGEFILGPDVVPVEYLESTGTQYINTRVNINDNDFALAADFVVAGTVSVAWARFFGSYTSESAACTRMINYSTQTNVAYCGYRRAANSQNTINPSYTNTRHVWKLSYMNLGLYDTNGTLLQNYSLQAPSGTTDTSSVLIFGAPIRLWGFSIKHGATTVLDLLPVRVGTEGAMMDTLTRKIYRNAGTGEFGVGTDVQ